MENGPKKPAYEPPKLGGEMERHGLVYDTLAVAGAVPQGGRQKRSRNRNKNNRRDHNRPTQKETFTMSENEVSQTNGSNDAGKIEARNHLGGDSIRDLTGVMQEHLKEQKGERGELRAHFKLIGDTLKEYNGHAVKLNEGMIETTAAATKAQSAAVEARDAVAHIPEKLNEVKNLDNLKGDVRRAVIQTAVSAAIGGIVVLAIAVFGSKPAATVEVETPQPAPTPRRATT